MKRWACFLVTIFLFSPALATDWGKYPETLPVFNYEGDKLQQYWDALTSISHVKHPDTDWQKVWSNATRA